MAGSKTDALEARFLDHLFKNGATPALAALGTVYVALWVTAAPSDTGTAGAEVTGSAYARVAVAAAGWNRSGSSVTNVSDIVFPTVTGSAYTVVGWAIFDAATGTTNMLFWGDTSSTLMNVGDTPRFASGALTITED